MSNPSFPEPTREHLEELMAGYVLNALSDAEKVEFESHLNQDPILSQQLQEWREVSALLAHSVQYEPPANLREKIKTISYNTQSSPSPPQAYRLRRSPWGQIAGAIAAGLIAVLGWQNYQLQQRLTTIEARLLEEKHEEHRAQEFLLKGKDAAVIAQAKVILDAYSGHILVGVENLPPLSEGEAYHLWAFTNDDRKILCGRFNTAASGQALNSFSLDAKVYDSGVKFLRISKEPAVTPPDPSRRTLLLTSES